MDPPHVGPDRPPTVLVLEDEPFIAMDLAEMLRWRGWTVLGPAPTVAAGLSLLEAERPDVALLDVNLGGELVTPVAAALRRLKIPFVVSSSYGDGELEGMEELGEAPRVRKPALAGELVVLAQEGRQLQRLEMVVEQELWSIAHLAPPASRHM